jgi:hypothetical protein
MGWDGDQHEERRRPASESSYRLGELERRVKVVEDLSPSLTAYKVNELEGKVDTLNDSFESLRKVLLGFALSIAGSAVVFALTVLTATGKI